MEKGNGDIKLTSCNVDSKKFIEFQSCCHEGFEVIRNSEYMKV